MARFDESLRNQLFTPEFCFIDIDHTDTLPEFAEGDTPTTVVKTPKGFHCYWEDRPFDKEEFLELCNKYGGDSRTRMLYRVGTNLDGFIYSEVNHQN